MDKDVIDAWNEKPYTPDLKPKDCLRCGRNFSSIKEAMYPHICQPLTLQPLPGEDFMPVKIGSITYRWASKIK